MKKFLSVLLVCFLLLTTAACGKDASKEGQVSKGDLSDITIGIVSYGTSETIEPFYKKVSEATGIKFKYVLGDSYDETKNVTAVQNLISSGVDGIIMTMDSGMEAIMKEAESANVYVAGYLTGMQQSMDKIKDNKYFLGAVNDGIADGSVVGNKAAELVIQQNKKSVGVLSFPKIYFPAQVQADEAFRTKIEEFNKTADAKDKITVKDTVELSFQPLEDVYFKQNPDIDSIFNLAAGFVYPTMVSANVKNITLYTAGYTYDESYQNAFKEGIIGLQTVSNTESMIYPIALIANAVKGETFSDQPETAEAVDTSVVFLTNKDELKAFEENTMNATGDASRALLSEDDIRNLIKVSNPDATYENLVKTIQSWSIEDILAKSK
jgi:ABC-type sugar transport system substrate-binding protein